MVMNGIIMLNGVKTDLQLAKGPKLCQFEDVIFAKRARKWV